MIDRVLAAKTEDFTSLVLAAGLSPGSDFRNALLRGVDFARCDLDAFDFGGTIFDGCRFDGAFIAGARFEGACFRNCSPAEAADYGACVSAQDALARGAILPADVAPEMPRSATRGAGGETDHARSPRQRPDPSPETWRTRCLCEVANFPLLRREIGTHRATRLMFELSERIEDIILAPHNVSVSRSQIEIGFEGALPEKALSGIERVHRRMSRSLTVEGRKLKPRILIGMAVAPPGVSDDRLLEAAETALERAREEGPVAMIDLSRDDIMFDRLGLLDDFPRAIEADELFLQYQPKVHLMRQEVVGAEALVRWSHPTRGLILPADFIPVIEEGGEAAALTLWTLRRVIEDQKLLRKAGYDIALFLNLPAVLLGDAGFVKDTCVIVDAANARIGIEITETAVIRDPDTALRHLQIFAERGIAIAIDDYGSGLSSLAYLRRLPATELKIDRMFVSHLTDGTRDPLIVRSTIDLAHALDMEVTAEGVETTSALALLSVMGCDMAQGYLISRPLSLKALRNFLSEARSDTVAETLLPEGRGHFWKRA